MPRKKNPIQKAAIIDVETTGLSAGDEVVELTAILFSFNRDTGEKVEILDEYSGLREPGCAIHPIAQSKHGLTLDVLRGQCLDDGRVCEIINQADYLIAHNASFDRRFVASLYPDLPTQKWLCTVQSFNWHSKGYKNEQLETLLKGHNIVRENTHRAGDDARALMELIFRVDAGTQKPYFAELLQSKPLGRPRSRPDDRPRVRREPVEFVFEPGNFVDSEELTQVEHPTTNAIPVAKVVLPVESPPTVGNSARKWKTWQIGAVVVAGLVVLGCGGCLGLSVLGRLLGY